MSGPFGETDDSATDESADGGDGLIAPYLNKRTGSKVLFLVALLVIVWQTRSLYHGAVYLVAQNVGAFLYAGLIVGGVKYYLRRKNGKPSYQAADARIISFVMWMFAFCIVSMVFLVFAQMYSGAILGQETIKSAEEVESVPSIDPEHPRILTKRVSEKYVSNSMTSSKYQAKGGSIVVYNNHTYWGYAKAPETLWNRWTKHQQGIMLADMETQKKNITTISGQFKYGKGMSWSRGYRWHLINTGPYLVDYQKAETIPHNGDLYLKAPYTKLRFHISTKLGFPMLVTTEKQAGVALINEAGDVRHLSMQEARQSPVLNDQPILHYQHVKQRVASTTYRNGIVNTFASGNQTVEISDAPGESNTQPFYVRTTDGPKLFVAVEPTGDTQAIKELWMTPADRYDFKVYRPNESQSFISPRVAEDYVTKLVTDIPWRRYNTSEPIPAPINNKFYWEIRIVPKSGAGISHIVFVNAEKTGGFEAETVAEVKQFLRTGNETMVGSQTQNSTAPGGREAELVIKKKNSEGEVVKTMYVYENETVVMSPAGNRTQTNSTQSQTAA